MVASVIHTARTHPIDVAQADYLAGMVALSELVYESETISDIIFKENIMDIIRESSHIQQFKQEGREEGFEQGGRKRAIEDILELLEIRFDLSEAHPLSARIAAIDDLQRLKQLLRAAVQVSNLDEFGRLLDATCNLLSNPNRFISFLSEIQLFPITGPGTWKASSSSYRGVMARRFGSNA